MNDIPKVVFSKKLSDAEATWPVRGSPGELVETTPFPSGILLQVYRAKHT